MQNLEYKAELRDLPAARRQCAVLGAVRVGAYRETDTYYRLAEGRLKRREVSGEPPRWILYHRPDIVTPALSNYSILTNEEAVRRWGTQSLRHWLVVRKTRELWMLGNVRIHMDDVDHLGRFFELEAIVSPRIDIVACRNQVKALADTFRPILGEGLSVSYSDLMEQLVTGYGRTRPAAQE